MTRRPKQKFGVARKIILCWNKKFDVAKKVIWCRQKRVDRARKSISCQPKKSWCSTKKCFLSTKQDDAASKKYFVCKKVFPERRAINYFWEKNAGIENMFKICKLRSVTRENCPLIHFLRAASIAKLCCVKF